MVYYLSLGICIIIALVLHEVSHGLVSYYLGDPTAKNEGRLTLNPLKHLDLFGTLSLFIFHFGWAKPVMINPTYYKNRKVGTMLVALAGPCANFLLVFVGAIGLKISFSLNIVWLLDFFMLFMAINVGLGLFNLLPFPPLDGSKILMGLLPTKVYNNFMQYDVAKADIYGMFILILVLCTGILNVPLSFLMERIIQFFLGVVGL